MVQGEKPLGNRASLFYGIYIDPDKKLRCHRLTKTEKRVSSGNEKKRGSSINFIAGQADIEPVQPFLLILLLSSSSRALSGIAYKNEPRDCPGDDQENSLTKSAIQQFLLAGRGAAPDGT